MSLITVTLFTIRFFQLLISNLNNQKQPFGILNKLLSKINKIEKRISIILTGVPEKCLPLKRWLQLPVGTIVTVSGAASAPNLWIQPQSVTGLITRSTAGSATDVWGNHIFGWGMIKNIRIGHLPVQIRIWYYARILFPKSYNNI